MQTFDFTSALPAHTSSSHTQRAYYRWVDRYLADVANMKPLFGEQRLARIRQLPVKTLARILTEKRFERWLQNLADEGASRQTLDQARAALVTLAELFARAKWIDAEQARALRDVSVPLIEKNLAGERLLSADELRQIMASARDIATSPQQRARNDVIVTMLCVLPLRREELSSAKWGDLGTADSNVVLTIDKGDPLILPSSVVNVIDAWRNQLQSETPHIPPHSPLIRRIWKGGRIAKDGLSPDGIWLTIRNASHYAGLGHVTPDDLRRSAVVGLLDAGLSVEAISRILRHRSVLITERFLARLALLDNDDE
jgi:integrase